MIQHHLIDADLMVYSVGHGCQRTNYIVDVPNSQIETREFTNKSDVKVYIQGLNDAYPGIEIKVKMNITAQPENYALHAVKCKINACIEQCKEIAGSIRPQLFLTADDKSNFRYEIAKKRPYKGQRGQKPIHYKILREYIVNRYGGMVVSGREADDEIAELARSAPSIISSYDKDFLTVAGWHHNPRTGMLQKITEEISIRNFYKQMLVGDSADNIEGIYGIGNANAEKILAQKLDERGLFDKTLEIYREKSDEDHFWENVDLLWIGHDIDRLKSLELRQRFLI